MNLHGPEVRDALKYYATPPLDPGFRFFFVRSAARDARAHVCQSERGLAQHIDGVIKGRKVELAPAMLYPRGKPVGVVVAAIYLLSEDNRQDGFLGYAYNDGRPWTAMRDALYRLRPNTGQRAQSYGWAA